MLRVLLVFLFTLGSAIAVVADDIPTMQAAPKVAEQCITVSGLDKATVDRSGCCSWHKGVCGCSGGSQKCCDGTFSPSCLCHQEDNNKVTN